jgi:phenylpropionate dioxygenase-like ring-hydroxylating dioxygenase large terminal subunit
VQRFGDELRGFENKCVHRFFPLRTADKGNGVIRCGFHHWQYDKDGRAVGIPKCQEMFGVTPRELDKRLKLVDIATCGIMVFGRFAGAGQTETLEQYLAGSFPILQTIADRKDAPYLVDREVKANWKLLLHVALDEYHVVAVHPDTFGKLGYLSNERIRYYRYGRHNCYFAGTDADTLATASVAASAGKYNPRDYRIYQLFPNLTVSHVYVARSWYILFMLFVPLAADRTLVRTWFYRASFPLKSKNLWQKFVRRYFQLWLPLFMHIYLRKVAGEDSAVCEKLQTVAHQIDGWPTLSKQEERIGWFEDAYAEAMAPPDIHK